MKNQFNVLPHTPWTAKKHWSIEYHSLVMLIISLTILGMGEGLLLLANLGSAPWTVLSQGVALQAGFNVGWASLIISAIVMLMWFPLKLRAGLGTVLNTLLVALSLGITVDFISVPHSMLLRFTYALLGIFLFGVASAFYLTCHQGAGPRDGLMVGLCQRWHCKVGIVRTLIEITVCAIGFCLGGTVGIGTLLFAFSIGWIVQLTLNTIGYCLRLKK
ncbi:MULTISPECIES: membrane protein YczE [unclassified Avibacterium]|uniref:membrane protein YczE n=1 Tax=unclassified Avibacterium TaxID=2685287 RepID=UPI0020262F72|nr:MULTISPECIES: YitT family protein [unclassified Avibacterium]MCW9698886.1 YitT family protein [Avibacterium sp. 20-129]MCW9732668.1 YitT family protein [Avibacterium sp. 20-15]URL04817.1 YitT family protein [Avibacterium sp. 20-132]URL06898.1 YitT family protein [Avibacterium sp. 21-595]